MNERIKELLLKAGWDRYEALDERNQKFAELIVQECIACVRGAVLADDVALRNNLGFNDGITEGVVHIQKHFGVKE